MDADARPNTGRFHTQPLSHRDARVIIIGMMSVGIVGYATSALVRLAGDYLMQWRVRELALGGGR